nr:hypothetical protein [Tanacetum cinerariifolium]
MLVIKIFSERKNVFRERKKSEKIRAKRMSEFSLVTDFACEKLVFPEYINDDIPLFLSRVFSDKAKNLENKASLGKAAKGKDAKGKAAKAKNLENKASLGKAAKGKDAKGKAAKGLDIGIVPQQLSLVVDDQNGFTHDDEPEAEQDGSGASDRASVGAKFEEQNQLEWLRLKKSLICGKVDTSN